MWRNNVIRRAWLLMWTKQTGNVTSMVTRHREICIYLGHCYRHQLRQSRTLAMQLNNHIITCELHAPGRLDARKTNGWAFPPRQNVDLKLISDQKEILAPWLILTEMKQKKQWPIHIRCPWTFIQLWIFYKLNTRPLTHDWASEFQVR